MANCLVEEQFVEEREESKFALALRTVYVYFKYCNLKCRHCWINPPYSDNAGLKEDELSMADIISALEECRALGMRSVKITGGEPFVRKDIFELLNYLKEKKIGITIETNAALIREPEARALKDALVNQAAVSLDGPDAAAHESLRGVEGSFDDAVEGIKALKKEGLNIQIIIALWKGNKERVKETILLAESLGAGTVKINPINNISRADNMKQNDETLSVEETIAFYRALSESLGAQPPIRVIFDIPPAFRPIRNMRLEHLGTCSIFNILGILGDGRISICGIGSVADTLVLGKVGENRIRDIWQNHSVLKDIRENVPGRMQGVCAKCMLKSYCLGKCRAEAYYTNGSLLAPLGFCQAAYEAGLFPLSRLA